MSLLRIESLHNKEEHNIMGKTETFYVKLAQITHWYQLEMAKILCTDFDILYNGTNCRIVSPQIALLYRHYKYKMKKLTKHSLNIYGFYLL